MSISGHLIRVALAVESVMYLLVVALALKGGLSQRRIRRRTAALYAGASFVWTLALLAWRLGWLDSFRADLKQRLPLYGLLFLSLLLLQLSRAFLRLKPYFRYWWWGLGLAWLALLFVLDGDLLPLADVWWRGDGRLLRRNGVSLGALAVGWGLPLAAAVLFTIQTFRRTKRPLHRNRILYWWPVLVLSIIGGAFVLAWHETLGSGLWLLGALVAAYAVVTHHLPDVRRTARRVVSYLFSTLLTVAIYTAGFATLQYLFEDSPGYSPLLAGAAMALILAVLFQPLLRLVQRLVTRLIFGSGYDPSSTLRQYSTSISNILDLGFLANVIVKLISEALGSQHGRLFLVYRQVGTYQLRDVGGIGERQSEAEFASESPVVNHLHQEQRPLTQYDVDLHSSFQEIPETELAWLASLGADVYVPIHAKGEWTGLLALGPKASGDRYFNEDLVLLSTLADQTAVALENARLVENLVQAHNDLGQAYGALNQANQQLQELDKLKSAFIGVITHELRTPYANIIFALELLERHGREHLPPELHEQLDQVNTGVKSAKMMIDNLVTFATFLSKQGELQPTQLDFGQVVEQSLLPLQTLAEAKQITLHTLVTDNLPPVQGDQGRLSDAMYHLVHNAIKFTESGGQVWIRCQTGAKTITFEVRDNGVGIPPDKLPNLWDDFSQMADPLRRGVEGLGLGLALVKYVVNAHGGEVWADSEPGSGSTFGFHIPLTGS
jgi:signal transduction histidine kinase